MTAWSQGLPSSRTGGPRGRPLHPGGPAAVPIGPRSPHQCGLRRRRGGGSGDNHWWGNQLVQTTPKPQPFGRLFYRALQRGPEFQTGSRLQNKANPWDLRHSSNHPWAGGSPGPPDPAQRPAVGGVGRVHPDPRAVPRAAAPHHSSGAPPAAGADGPRGSPPGGHRGAAGGSQEGPPPT